MSIRTTSTRTTRYTTAATATLAALVVAAPAAASSEPPADVITITIGASPTPHAEILEFIDDELAAAAGIDLEIVVFEDYILPNQALDEGEIDANYFQHLPYFESQIADRGYDLVAFPGVHIEPYGLYSSRFDAIDDLPDGAEIGVTTDPSNQARALELLAAAGLITVADTGDETPTLFDIDENPRGFRFTETAPEQLVRSLEDLDAAIINGNYALEAGLNPAVDALLLESGEDNPYANFVAARAEDADDPALLVLDELLHSEAVYDFIVTRWPSGEVIPAFGDDVPPTTDADDSVADDAVAVETTTG